MKPYIFEFIKQLMEKENLLLRMAIIAGATHALKYIQKNRNASHDDALRDVAVSTQEILDKIDDSSD